MCDWRRDIFICPSTKIIQFEEVFVILANKYSWGINIFVKYSGNNELKVKLVFRASTIFLSLYSVGTRIRQIKIHYISVPRMEWVQEDARTDKHTLIASVQSRGMFKKYLFTYLGGYCHVMKNAMPFTENKWNLV